jgi:DUF1009 family protein
MEVPHTLAIVAGSGTYPHAMVRGARKAGVQRIVVAAFQNETDPDLAGAVDFIEWMRVGQLGKMLAFLKSSGARHAVMSGQIAPKNLFNLRPDIKAVLLLAKLKERNAESIFGAIADSMSDSGVTLLPATTFMEECLAPTGLVAGPAPGRRELADLEYGFRIAKESSRLDIGQTVVVKSGTVLAVEAFEGTNAAILRGGSLGKKGAVMVKVSKPGQDLRFDVPVIGPLTLETAAEAGLGAVGVEAGQTLLLEKERMSALASAYKISIVGVVAQPGAS